MRQIRCTQCRCPAVLKHGKYGYYYQCPLCRATVGCHPNTTTPMGKFADSELKNLRKKAHDLFDRRWENHTERSVQYMILADRLGIPVERCHFAKMSKVELLESIRIMEE